MADASRAGERHLDVAGAVEQALVQRGGARALALRDLKVDVGLRQQHRLITQLGNDIPGAEDTHRG